MIYVGLDPGSDGAIAMLDDSMKLAYMPFKDKSSSEYSRSDIINKFMLLRNEFDPVGESNKMIIGIEDVHSIFNSSANSNFEFGGRKYELIMMAEMFSYYNKSILHQTIAAKEWQKAIWDNSDKRYESASKVNTKVTTLNAISRVFPGHEFKQNSRCSSFHSGICDAVGIALALKLENT